MPTTIHLQLTNSDYPIIVDGDLNATSLTQRLSQHNPLSYDAITIIRKPSSPPHHRPHYARSPLSPTVATKPAFGQLLVLGYS